MGEDERLTPFISADEAALLTPTAKRSAVAAQPAQPRSWLAVLRSPLWLCLLAGLLIRVWLSMRTHGTLDGDEALLGIQAEHILRGERPLYFYGLSYFGSLEAYVVAAVSAVFGPSVAVLRAVTTAFGLLLIALTWWFAGLLATAARLPAAWRRRFAICAALVAAIPPVYDGIIELRTGGGWIESFCLMLLLLILAFRLTTRWHAGYTDRSSTCSARSKRARRKRSSIRSRFRIGSSGSVTNLHRLRLVFQRRISQAGIGGNVLRDIAKHRARRQLVTKIQTQLFRELIDDHPVSL